MLIARCYVRVSTEDQAKEGYSLGAQRDRLAAFAASQGWKVADFYVDEGLSAKDMQRPALQRLMRDIKRGEVVLVYKLDRLTRNVGDLDYLLRRWESEGVLFRSSTEDFNTTTAAGRLFIRLVADLAQWERENLGERVRMGMLKKAETGEWLGGPPPFGYDLVETGEHTGKRPKRVLVPSKDAWVIRELYQRYVAGQGMRALAIWLNEKGIQARRGGKFTDATISGYLKNPLYCGMMTWNWGVKNGPKNPDAIVVEGTHEPIVDRQLWEQAQRIRLQRQSVAPRHATGVYVLTGIGRCGLCGAAISVATSRRKSGAVYHQYRCGSFKTKGECSLTGIAGAQVEAGFMQAVLQLAGDLADPRAAQRFANEYLRQEQDDQRIMPAEEIRRQIAQAKKAISVWDAALECGEIAFGVWQEKTAPHYSRLDELDSQLKSSMTAQSVGLAISNLSENLKNFKEIWVAATQHERKTIAASFFREVRIFPDKSVTLTPRFPVVYSEERTASVV